ncbi:MAG: glycosyltransferase family 87 protein, partial [Thermoleophilia bacterium]|nr:glycosyltransferase family 87 protein [Thermoleophilia bacterium]
MLILCWLGFAAVASGAEDPRLTDAEAKDIASAYGNIREVASKHIELERSAVWDASTHVWEVSWTNPSNYRKIISVEVDDDTGAVKSMNIRPEAYGIFLPMLSENEAIGIAGGNEKVRDEVEEMPEVDPSADLGDDRIWTVSYNNGNDTVVEVQIDDDTGTISEVRVGPQVAWQMARGYDGAFGRIVNKPYIWLPLCLLFVAPFVDFRRPFRPLHLDLLVLLSFTISHYYFNRGEIFTSVPLAYPPLAYLFLRLSFLAVIYRRRRESTVGTSLPVSTAAGTTLFARPRRPRLHLNFSPRVIFVALLVLLVFRITLNVVDSNVVDVGYSGVIGAHRILEGDTPYGTMPSDNSNGDTYGPLNYLIYVPFERVMEWSGSWDDLPAAHATAILFDLLAIAGMYVAGKKLGAGDGRGADPNEARRFGLALAWGWAAYPYTTFVLSCNVNDSSVAAIMIWGFVLIKRAPIAGLLLGFATQVKFFPALLGPLWASFPHTWRGWGRRTLFVLGFIVAAAITLPVIFLGEGTFTTFVERSLRWQIGRDSPFSIWGQHTDALAGIQRVGQYVLVFLAIASFFWPPRKSLGQLAAASAALLIGFEMLQTHWFYLYIPWFFPLAFMAILERSTKRPERPHRIAAMV